MNLKTLKELEEGKYMYKGLVQLRHVRDEAIKWVKEYYHPDKTNLPMSIWLDFFNITGEDLI